MRNSLSVYDTDDFIAYAARYLSVVKGMPLGVRNNLIVPLRSAMERCLNAGESIFTMVDRAFEALDGNMSRKGIAEHLFDDDFVFTGKELREAYNNFHNARGADTANGIDFSIANTGDTWRTTLDIYRYGSLVDFVDVCTADKPYTSDMGKFFDNIANEMENDPDGEITPISSYVALRAVINDIRELEREYIRKL